MKFLNLSLFVFAASLLTAGQSHASYALASKKGIITCSGEDNLVIKINSNRNYMLLTVEGEGGTNKATMKTDNQTYTSYSSQIGTLTLSDAGDTFLYADSLDGEAFEVRCK